MAELLIWLGAVSVAALSLLGLVDSFCYLWETRERPDESEAVIAYCEKKIREAEDAIHWMTLPEPPGKDNNVPAKAPNEPLTQEDIDKMHFDRVWIDYGLDDSGERCGEDGVILYGKLYSIDTLDGSDFEDLLLDACDGETLGRPSGDYTVYRRPPEGEEDT